MNTIYLVTGAAGFLGSNVCRLLLEKGHNVRGLVLPNDRYAQFLPTGTEVMEGDICCPDTLERFFTVPENTETLLIHCASMVTVNPDYNPLLVKVNVEGTENLITQCLSHSECRKMVYVGSTSTIPEQPKGSAICEVDNYAPERVEGWYSRTKAMASQKVMDAVREQGLRACIVHPSGILGPNDFSFSTTTHTLLQILQGKMPIGMKGSFNLCDVRDLAEGCILAAENGRIGQSYILGNEEVSLKELCRMLVAESGCRPIRFYLLLGLAARLAKQMEKKAAKKGNTPLLTSFSVYNLARNNQFDYSKARQELGYSPRSYKETLHDQVQWLIQSGQYIKA